MRIERLCRAHLKGRAAKIEAIHTLQRVVHLSRGVVVNLESLATDYKSLFTSCHLSTRALILDRQIPCRLVYVAIIT